MKKQIICMKCRAELWKLFPTDTPGEHVRFCDGKALDDYVCDPCGKEINIGDNCCAHTIWSDHDRCAQPYYSWEGKFVDILIFDNEEGEV